MHNPVYIDRRVGSVEMQPLLVSKQLDTETTELPFGDFCFQGNGPRGPALIGLERKRLSDMLSSIRSGRYSGHQLPGMIRHYEFSYLIVEGAHRANPQTGMLETLRRGGWGDLALGSTRFMYAELDNFLTSIELRSRVYVRRVDNSEMTASTIANLYAYWNKKTWGEHRAHLQFSEAHETALPVEFLDLDPARPRDLVRLVAKELKGVGWVKSADVQRKFNTVRELANAQPSEWLTIPGIGVTLSGGIVKAISGE